MVRAAVRRSQTLLLIRETASIAQRVKSSTLIRSYYAVVRLAHFPQHLGQI